MHENGEKMEANSDAKEEVPLRKDSVNEIADIEESVPNETEDKNIDKQRLVYQSYIEWSRERPSSMISTMTK